MYQCGVSIRCSNSQQLLPHMNDEDDDDDDDDEDVVMYDLIRSRRKDWITSGSLPPPLPPSFTYAP